MALHTDYTAFSFNTEQNAFFFFFFCRLFYGLNAFGSHDKWQEMVIMYTQLLTIQQPANAATTQQPENFSLLSSQENLPYSAAEKTCPYSAATAWACALKGEVKLHFTQKDGPRVAFLPLQHAQRVSDAWVCCFAEKQEWILKYCHANMLPSTGQEINIAQPKPY